MYHFIYIYIYIYVLNYKGETLKIYLYFMNCLLFYSGHFPISDALVFYKSVYTLKLSIHFCVCVAHYLIWHSSCNLCGRSYINYEFEKIKSKLIYSYHAIEKLGINAYFLL